MQTQCRFALGLVLALGLLSLARTELEQAAAPATPMVPVSGSHPPEGTTASPAETAAVEESSDVPETTAATTVSTEEDDCMDQMEYSNNPELLERLKKYDVAKVLEGLGGAPGEVNATRRPAASVPELEVDDAAAELTPLPDTDNQTYWLYDYGATDWRTYVGREHALVRAKGTARQYEDVRGEVWWSPPDLCGGLRHATYRRDAGGFVAEVLRAHCHIFRGSLELSCYGPDSENPCAFCISGVSGALIASLVG